MRGEALAITMRTPGHDEELALGRRRFYTTSSCVTGRFSFEVVQKAALAGAPVLVGVGAPTSLAVDLASDRGMTLCGFARGGAMNVYSGGERLSAD